MRIIRDVWIESGRITTWVYRWSGVSVTIGTVAGFSTVAASIYFVKA